MGLAMILAIIVFGGTAWGAEQKWGDTGTVAAVNEAGRIVVVEIPRGTEKLTVGAELAPDAVLRKGENAIGLSNIKTGDRVRLEWSCGDQGCTAHKIIVLQPAK